MSKEQHQIGHVTGTEESHETHPYYSLAVILGVYCISVLPIWLLAYSLSMHNNWADDVLMLFFAICLMIWTVAYVSMVLGVTTKIIKATYMFIYRMYVVNRQHNIALLTVRGERQPMRVLDNPNTNVPQLVDKNYERELLTDYVKYLYQKDADDNLINIYEDGRIKGAVPWSTRERKINERTAMRWFDTISLRSSKKPFMYYRQDKKGWYVNIADYPSVTYVLKSFEHTYVPNVQLEDEGEYRDA